jgi:hypothetical protein
MRTIYKYRLPAEAVTIPLPEGAFIISVHMQEGDPHIWADVDTSKPLQQRRFRVFGTGHPLPAGDLHFIGTLLDGPFVWHVVEVL